MYFALLYSAFKPSKAQNAAKKQHKHTAGAIISFLLHFIHAQIIFDFSV